MGWVELGLKFYDPNPTQPTIKKNLVIQPNPTHQALKNWPNSTGWIELGQVELILVGWLHTPTHNSHKQHLQTSPT